MNKSLIKIPPFQDAHIHFMIDGRQATWEESLALNVHFFSKGITAVADMGHKSGLGIEFKKGFDRKSPFLVKVRSAGLALHQKGGYGGFLGKGVSGRQEIRSAVQALARSGADFIKIINSGIVSLQEEKPVTYGGFSDEDWKFIEEEAGFHGLPIRCHANSDPAIRQAVDYGAASIEHGFFISRETLRVMAEQGVAWTPTVIAFLSLKPSLSPEEQNRVDRVVDLHLAAVHFAASIGVKLQVGTDSGSKGVIPGESFFKELGLFRKAGLTLEQILSAACPDPEAIDRGDYLLVEKNFIEREKVEAVYLSGVQIRSGSRGQGAE